MTPQEKANELYNQYQELIKDFTKGVSVSELSKECALIVVDEILNEYWLHDTKRRDWWQEVKQEIENI